MCFWDALLAIAVWRLFSGLQVENIANAVNELQQEEEKNNEQPL